MALRLLLIFHTIIASICLHGCKKAADNPVPRPEAYPRVETYPARYDTISAGNLLLPVNSSAGIKIQPRGDSNVWIDVSYPRYHATLRYTLSLTDRKGVAEAIDNRLTRMSLNAGSNTTEIIELSSREGITSTILVTPGATVTPVQILSTDSAGFMLSGVLEINNPSATREEIAPVVSAVKDDILYTAKHISSR